MKPKPAADLWQILRDQLSACVKCGACLAFCPLYTQERREGASMRGKIALLQAWLIFHGEGLPTVRPRGEPDRPPALGETGPSPSPPGRQGNRPDSCPIGGRRLPAGDLREALSFCTGCQSCRAVCPNGVDTNLVTLLGRLLLPKNPLQALREWGWSLLVSRPWGRRLLGRILFGTAGRGAAGQEGRSRVPGGRNTAGDQGRESGAAAGSADDWEHAAPAPGPGQVAEEGKTPPPSPEVLRPRPAKGSSSGGDGGSGPVILVPGCRLAGFPSLVETAATLMAACLGGQRPVVETACCGELALEIPDLEGYARQLGAWLEAMASREPRRIVVACPHCLEALGRARDLCQVTPGEARLLDRVTDLYSWLVEAGFRPLPQEGASAILLDVCANRKDKAMSRAARELLGRRRPGGVEEPALTGGGCTCRSGFGWKHPAVARALRERVTGGEGGAGGRELVTVCASCLSAWKQTRSGRVTHLIEALAGVEGVGRRPEARGEERETV